MSLRPAGRIWPAGTEPPAATDQPRGQCPPDLARAQIDGEFAQRFRVSFLQRRRDALAVILDRAHARGEVTPNLARGTIADVVFSVTWSRLPATKEPLDDRLASEIADALTGRIDHGQRDRVRRQ